MSIFAALLLAAAPLPAEAGCAAPAPLAEPWTSWTQSGQVRAGTQADGAPSLILGKPVTATLTPADYVHYVLPPAKGAASGHGGIFTLSLRTAARVGIALSGRAWIDVVAGADLVPSVDHGHGPQCSGIRKIVWFDMTAGRHIVQVAGSPDAEIRLMAADAVANQPAQ
ncbi:hypothetical protein J3E64_001389 [Sphingobium sp. OAS761]|uniref:hypothetical protein n=1 Tax=Sphingobium sp. OAS761 TaxID=2817901 RepID=UPI00209CC984|nr:hypothetical protein [Sphingobium sp. OAS761]MCP1469707.1 hypothetical protein [Sphingobium sp. OAS761]